MWIPGYIIFRGGRCSQWASLYTSMPVTGIVPTAINFAYYYFSYVQWQMFYLLTLNRFISVYKPLSSANIWRRITPILYVIVIISPLIFTWHLIWYGAELSAKPYYYLNVDEVRSFFFRNQAVYNLIEDASLPSKAPKVSLMRNPANGRYMAKTTSDKPVS
ncbi:srg family chemoreceptor domain-containing protein [Ditylenchus destructor]|nr:srg family chemoreceptor domain-containing protein [Ditylenchus destructor]